MLNKVKTIRGYAGLARFLETFPIRPVGYLARVQVEEIPSPYSYSPSVLIYQNGTRQVVVFETSHKRYGVFEVPPELLRFKTDDEATDWHIRFSRKSA